MKKKYFDSNSSMQQFYIDCMHVLTGSILKGDKTIMSTFFVNVYSLVYPTIHLKVSEFKQQIQGLSSLKSTLAREMATNASNAFLCACQERTKGVLRAMIFSDHPEIVSGKRRKLMVDKVIRMLFQDKTETTYDDLDLCDVNSEDDNSESIITKYIARLQNEYHAPLLSSKTLSTYLDYYRALMLYMDDYKVKKGSMPEEISLKMPKVKRWSYLPLRSFQLTSILIDTDLLCGFMKRSGLLTEKIDKTEFGNNQTYHWYEAFNLLETTPNNNRLHFGHSIRTDGVQCSLLMYRLGSKRFQTPKSSDSNPKPKSKIQLSSKTRGLFFEKQVQLEEDYNISELIGVDPGHKIMMQCYDNEKDEYFRLTRREYLGRGMFKQQRRVIEGWKNDKTLSLSLESNLQFRVPMWSQMVQSLKIYNQINEDLYAHYCTKRFKNLKFKVYRFKNKVLDQFMTKFYKKKKSTTVAYGSAKFSINSKGSIRVPQQGLIDKLKHRVKVVLTSEYMTSQKCSTCESQTTCSKKLNDEDRAEMMKQVPESLLTKLKKDADLVRGLRLCSNKVCNSQFLHRDENASKNILKALSERITMGRRPEYLSWTKKSKERFKAYQPVTLTKAV